VRTEEGTAVARTDMADAGRVGRSEVMAWSMVAIDMSEAVSMSDRSV
jgi:hypothetical protein